MAAGDKIILPIHGSDHCPGGPDPIPCLAGELPWARVAKGFDSADQVIPNNSHETVIHNVETNMAPGDSGAPFFEIYENLTPATIGILVVQDSLVHITATVTWDSAISSTWYMGVSIAGNSWIHECSFAGQTSTTNIGTLGFMHRITADTPITLLVWQITGGNRDLDAAVLEVVRMGAWTGIDWEDEQPGQ